MRRDKSIHPRGGSALLGPPAIGALVAVVVAACGGGKGSSVDEPDADEDGYALGEDCNDGDPTVFPGATERCDGLDDDCDGEIEDYVVAFGDADGDGWGDPADEQVLCDGVPAELVDNNLDCDDTDQAVHPTADDPPCQPIDYNCDGIVIGDGMVWVPALGARSDLSSALDEMPENSEVWLCPGEYQGPYTMSRSGTILAFDPEGATSIVGDPDQFASSLYVAPFVRATIEGVTMRDGYSLVGGAIYVGQGASLTVRDTVFQSNVAASAGGAIYADPYSAVDISDSGFVANSSSADGGALWASSAVVTLSSCVFSDNEAGREGGAVYLSQSRADLVDTEIMRGAAAYGGGLAADYSEVDLGDADIHDNEASYGGGLYLVDSSLAGGSVRDNDAAYGGGVFFRSDYYYYYYYYQYYYGYSTYGYASTPVVVDGLVVDGNHADTYGGGVYVDSGAWIVLGDVALVGNDATYGGAVALLGGQLDFGSEASIVSNTADPFGGGVYLSYGRIGSAEAWWGMSGTDANTPDDVWSAYNGAFDVEGFASFECTEPSIGGCTE